MTSLIFPDLNVWLALSIEIHPHHARAWEWYRALRGEELAFCRVTQLGLLRLLTTASASGDAVLNQQSAWKVYDAWLSGGRVTYLEEPPGLDLELRFYANRTTPSPKEWGDSYLLAFAAAASLTMVTFDKALSQRYARTILLTS